MSLENIEKFVDAFARSLSEGTFVKMSLGHYKGADEHLQKLLLRLIDTKKGRRVFFLYRYDTRDTAKNHDFGEAAKLVAEHLESGFFSDHLFTTANDFQLEIGRKGKSRLNIARPTIKSAPPLAHDRDKKRFVNQHSHYLRALGITTDTGEVRDKQQDKWRQINKFVETLSSLVEKSRLAGREKLRIVDMGCGKGYLTFAAYDFFRNIRGIDVSVTGVDTKSQLVEYSNDIARASEFDSLEFVCGRIENFEIGETDILIALHACNTATDDAIQFALAKQARFVVLVPCCQAEVASVLRKNKNASFGKTPLSEIWRHPIHTREFGSQLTNVLRCLQLEAHGYQLVVTELVGWEHSLKNELILARRTGAMRRDAAARLAGILRELKLDELHDRFLY